MDIGTKIKASLGEKEADILFTNARIVDVFSGEIIPGEIAITGGFISGFGSYSAKKIVDLEGRFVAPGFIDPHVHIESSMACVTEFCRAVLPYGTTSVVADPHEIANVLGKAGIDYMLRSSENQPVDIYYTLPSCVPATEMETAGARLSADDLIPFMNDKRIVALAEMMNFPGVIFRDPDVLAKIENSITHKKPVDGHAPGLSGKELFAYIAAGISSDHECTTVAEAKEKLSAGMHIMIREGTAARNLHDLLPLVNEKNFHRIMWCTDDRHPHDLIEKGHIDSMVREAVRYGLDPVTAIRIATINPAVYFGLNHKGAVAPGRQADLVIFSDLSDPIIEQVYSRGILVAENGKMRSEIIKPALLQIPSSMNTKKKIDFSIPAISGRIRVIEVIPDQILTRHSLHKALVVKGMAVPDISNDVLKIAVIERHHGSGNIGKGFVKGFNLKKGAIASSVAHDSHNIIVVGTNDEDMKAAVDAVIKMGGGLAAACDCNICSTLSLPIAGLMSNETVETIDGQMENLLSAARSLGSSLSDPYMALSFLALPVIPELKITDKGLVDVGKFCIVPLFEPQ
ncbi:MAG: adenine deaminase [Desulfobacteraceae bacterium A6]|nr:MAG: adenine deaminase [Desulfobacteraceae bacterium A6]